MSHVSSGAGTGRAVGFVDDDDVPWLTGVRASRWRRAPGCRLMISLSWVPTSGPV